MFDLMIVSGVGLISGLTTVLFGFGGGFIAVPFVYHFLLYTSSFSSTESMIVAVATSTAVMIMNTGYASYKSYRGKLLKGDILFPLALFIGLGAIFGSYTSTIMTGDYLRYIFFIYIAITILDCLFRRGFMEDSSSETAFKLKDSLILGPIIGYIAAMLGVGGSVMTVPTLRRKGYSMKVCVSSANPLAMPVAVVGTLMYAILGYGKHLGEGYMGYVNTKIFLILAVSGFLGIFLSKKFLPSIKDSIHAKAYVALLFIVLVSMIT